MSFLKSTEVGKFSRVQRASRALGQWCHIAGNRLSHFFIDWTVERKSPTSLPNPSFKNRKY